MSYQEAATALLGHPELVRIPGEYIWRPDCPCRLCTDLLASVADEVTVEVQADVFDVDTSGVTIASPAIRHGARPS